jgi:hypothetical protein
MELVWQDYVARNIQELYEIRDYHHAATILANEFRSEFKDVCRVLSEFRITTADILAKGGNESAIPKNFSAILRAMPSYVNYYRCPNDGTEWVDCWSSMCNDRCPRCNAEIEPFRSDVVDVPLAHELTMLR